MRDSADDRFQIVAYGVDPWIAAAMVSPGTSCVWNLDRLTKIGPSGSKTAWPVGLEIAVQECSFCGQPNNAGCRPLIEDFGVVYRPRTSVRPLSRYPPSELAAYYLFRKCDRLSVAALCKANALLGGSGAIRTHEHQSSKYPSSHRSVFLPAKSVGAELDYLVSKINGKSDLDSYRFAVSAMIHSLIIHPFSDGNGRLACLLFQYCLFKRAIMDYPLIPLSPFLEKNRSEWLHVLLKLNEGHIVTPIYDFLALAVEATARAVERTLTSRDVSQSGQALTELSCGNDSSDH